MKTHRILGVGFHEVDLLLELQRVGPIVVPLAESDVFASGFRVNELGKQSAHTLGILILLVVDGANVVRMPGCVLADDFRGAVC